jgi:hypothetical protein
MWSRVLGEKEERDARENRQCILVFANKILKNRSALCGAAVPLSGSTECILQTVAHGAGIGGQVGR